MESIISSSILNAKHCILVLCILIAALSTHPCDARRSMQYLSSRDPNKHPDPSIMMKKPNAVNRLDLTGNFPSLFDLSPPNAETYGVSSPFSLPPFDSLAPTPLPESSPPYSVYPPPSTLHPPTTIITSPSPPTSAAPSGPVQSNPPAPIGPFIPSPPETTITPGPPSPIGFPFQPSPPATSYPSPPVLVPIPPSYTVPSPAVFIPSPPVFLPPVVYPPPSVPPPPATGPPWTLWCVAKPSVPEPIIQEAMNYACGSGADCDSIEPSGSCFQPNTLLAHASYAFNSYWQRTRVAGGTCEFGGTGMLVSVDPSYDGCRFLATPNY